MPDPQHKTEAIAIRRVVYFHGNVQGVGFRYTTCQIARDYAVVGYVKNLLDGRVEVVAEALPHEVDRFLAAVERSMKGYVEYTSSTDSTALGNLTSFGIEY